MNLLYQISVLFFFFSVLCFYMGTDPAGALFFGIGAGILVGSMIVQEIFNKDN